MKNTIPFTLFGGKQEIGFTILDIRTLERALEKPVQLIFKNAILGVDLCLSALPILLNMSENQVVGKIEKYLNGGGTIDQLAMPIVSALSVTGVIGKSAKDTTMAFYYPTENVTDEELTGKNEEEAV